MAIYCRMLRSELHGYVPSTRNKNFDFVDRAARKWLARRKEDVLISRVWLKTECLRLLHEAARVCTIDEFLREGAVFKCWFEIFMWQSFYLFWDCLQAAGRLSLARPWCEQSRHIQDSSQTAQRPSGWKAHSQLGQVLACFSRSLFGRNFGASSIFSVICGTI